MENISLLAEDRLAAARRLAQTHAPFYPLTFLRGAKDQALREWMCEGAFPGGGGCLAFEYGPPDTRWLLVANRVKWDFRLARATDCAPRSRHARRSSLCAPA